VLVPGSNAWGVVLPLRRGVYAVDGVRQQVRVGGYNSPAMMPSYRAQLIVALAVFVLVFASLHFYFDAVGLCGLGGCPEPSQSSHAAHSGSSSTACVAAVLVASLTPSLVPFSGRRLAAKHRCPAEVYPSPDTPPPRG